MTAVTPSAATARSTRRWAAWQDLADLAGELRAARDQPGGGFCLQPHRPRARMGAQGPRRRPGLPGLLPHVPRPRLAGPLREPPCARSSPMSIPARSPFSPDIDQLGLDHLPLLPVGSELRQPGRLHRHGAGDARPGQRGRGGAAPGRGGLHLEAAGHRLREPARGAHADPGLQRRRAHRRPGAAVQIRGHRPPGRGGALHPTRTSASFPTTRC